jgi:hypothetical protein
MPVSRVDDLLTFESAGLRAVAVGARSYRTSTRSFKHGLDRLALSETPTTAHVFPPHEHLAVGSTTQTRTLYRDDRNTQVSRRIEESRRLVISRSGSDHWEAGYSGAGPST